MTGINNIHNVSDTRMKHYKEWIVETQGKDINEYIGDLINREMETLKKQDGRCKERSILLTKGQYKGSCTWSSKVNAYRICLRMSHKQMAYGFFSNLYSAERELKRLFKNDEKELVSIAREQQKHYQKQHRLATRPRLTDNTVNIIHIVNSKKKGVTLCFAESFDNPFKYTGKSNTSQKSILFGKYLFEHYPKKQILKECVKMDDPIKILKFREGLKRRLREYKEQLKNEEENDELEE